MSNFLGSNQSGPFLKPNRLGKLALLNKKFQIEQLKRACDRLCNEYVKLRDKRVCQRCGSSRKKMDWAHFFGRGKWALRWEPENSLTLCSGCHRYFDTMDRGEFEELMLKRLGNEKYESLILRKHNRFRMTISNLKLVKQSLQGLIDGFRS